MGDTSCVNWPSKQKPFADRCVHYENSNAYMHAGACISTRLQTKTAMCAYVHVCKFHSRVLACIVRSYIKQTLPESSTAQGRPESQRIRHDRSDKIQEEVRPGVRHHAVLRRGCWKVHV